MNLAAWVAIYLILVLASIGGGIYWGFGVGLYIGRNATTGPKHPKRFPIDLDELDRPTGGVGED